MSKKIKILGCMLVLLLAFNCSNNSEEEVVTKEEEKEEVTDPKEEETPKEEEKEEEEETTAKPPVCDGVKQAEPTLVDKSVEPVPNEADKCSVFLEENGLLVMEAENTKSDYDKWVFSNDELTVKDKNASDIHTTVKLKDHRGTGYLRFTGKWGKDEEKSPLSYTFKIKNAGNYRLMIRNLKGLHEESDKNNDCFIRMEGDDFGVGTFDTCVNENTELMLPESKSGVLKRDVKFFGASNEAWKPAGKFDVHGDGYNRPWAVYNFKEGGTYTLVISGRSSKYYIDRIVLYDLHKYNYGDMAKYAAGAVQSACE